MKKYTGPVIYSALTTVGGEIVFVLLKGAVLNSLLPIITKEYQSIELVSLIFNVSKFYWQAFSPYFCEKR